MSGGVRRGLLTGLGIAAAAGVLWIATLSQNQAECEACMRYGGQRVCSRVAGPSVAEAEHRAITHACSVLSHGVTRGLECQRTPPESLECQG